MHVASLGVSSATIRNTLAELEDLGFLQQPHTSAGRIPTDRGYRFYVDQLLAAPRSVRGGAAVEAQLRRDAGTPALAEDVLSAVSQVLSRASRLVAFALPMSADGILKEIEFIPLSSTRFWSSWWRTADRFLARRSTSANRSTRRLFARPRTI